MQSIADGVFTNQKAIERNHADNQKSFKQMYRMTTEIHQAVFGNGDPERGLRYRVSWQERMTRILILAALANTIMTFIVGIIVIYHAL